MAYNIYQKIGDKSRYPVDTDPMDAAPAETRASVSIDGVANRETMVRALISRQEEDYWRTYQTAGSDAEAYAVYRDAYLYGIRAFLHYRTPSFEEIEAELSAHWLAGNNPALGWEEARPAARAAYNRLFGRKSQIESLF